MKIFKMNDCDWWMAETIEQAVADYKAFGSILDIGDVRELTDEELDRMRYVDCETGSKMTFRQHMNELVGAGKASEFFATTEY